MGLKGNVVGPQFPGGTLINVANGGGPYPGGSYLPVAGFGFVYDWVNHLWHPVSGLATGELSTARIDGVIEPVLIGTITANSPAAPGVAHTATQAGFAKWENVFCIGELLGATGGGLNVRIQDKPDSAAADFYDLLAFNTVPLLTAAAEAIQRMHVCLTGVPNKIGKNDAPRLTPGTCVGGMFGDVWRVSFEALTGTSAAASQTVKFYGTKLR
jgi:hypothetical protein